MRALRPRWTALPGAARVVIAVAVFLVGVNIAGRALDEAVGGSAPGGTPSSSYAHAPDGMAAYAELLTRYDHDIERRRGELDARALDAGATLMVLDADLLNDEEAASLLEFVTRGGRLVIGGQHPGNYLHDLRAEPPTWEPEGPTEWRDVDESLASVERVVTAGAGAWSDPAGSHPLVEQDGAVLLAVERVGGGEILYLADTSPLRNDRLATADNAAFGVLLAGEPGRPVAFAEGVHGYGADSGLGAIPERWKLALAFLAVAVLAYAWARGKRLGPPEARERPPAPARREYVDALAVTLQRTRCPDAATAGLRAEVRSRIAARAGLDAHATDDALERAATRLGFAVDEIAAVTGIPASDDELLALGRALARVESWNSGRTS